MASKITVDAVTPQSTPGRGVALNAPPPSHVPSIMAAMDKALSYLPKEATGALVGLVNQDQANLAVVVRTHDGFAVQAWVGKTWRSDSFEYGAALRKVW